MATKPNLHATSVLDDATIAPAVVGAGAGGRPSVQRTASYGSKSNGKRSGGSISSSPPPAPTPSLMAGYLKKLKSEEGSSKIGSLFNRGKFNKRWFMIQEQQHEQTNPYGLLYELKYWKVSADVDSKLPGFVLDLSDIRGCDIGVGLGPYTTEPNTFHIETTTRTYVLTASSEEEMKWWITGVNYYVWQHKQTHARMEQGESTASGGDGLGVLVSSPNDPFAVDPKARRNSLPNRMELGSPVSSTDGSVFNGSPDPLRQQLSPFEPSPSPLKSDDEKMVVQLKEYEDSGRRNPFAVSPRDNQLMESQELERKYDDDHHDVKPSAAVTPAIQVAKSRPKPGELSSPIRFDNPDIETARPPPPSTERAGLSQPIRFNNPDIETARSEREQTVPAGSVASSDPAALSTTADIDTSLSDDPFHAHHSDRKSAIGGITTVLEDEPSHRYPELETLRSNDGHDQVDQHLNDASAPPQTERPGITHRVPSTMSSPIVSASTNIPSTNPHLTKQLSTDDPFAHHDSEPSYEPDLGGTMGEASFRVVSIVRETPDPRMTENEEGHTSTHQRTDDDDQPAEEDHDPFAHHAKPSPVLHAQEPPSGLENEEDHIQSVLGESEQPVQPTVGETSLGLSLEAGDDSIINGSIMLHDSIEVEPIRVPASVPQLKAPAAKNLKLPPLGGTALAPSSTTTATPIPSQPTIAASSQPTITGPPATLLPTPNTIAQPASTSAPAAVPAPVLPKFSPSNTATCNTAEHFRTLRRELRAYGVQRVISDQLLAGWFVEDADKKIKISTGVKPFNAFARLVSGALVPPYPNLFDQYHLSSFNDKYFVARNKPEFAEQWASADPEWVGKASMAERHEFLLIRSLDWNTFNVATFGMEGEAKGASLEIQRQNLKDAISLLDDLARTAALYTTAAGWSNNLGLFFHSYPFNSVQALHLHMLDMNTIGPTFHHLNHKNLPLSEARIILQEELAKIEPIIPTPIQPTTTTIPTSSVSSTPADKRPIDSTRVALNPNLAPITPPKAATSTTLPPLSGPLSSSIATSSAPTTTTTSASTNWQSDLSSLLAMDKLPYQDIPTARQPTQRVDERMKEQINRSSLLSGNFNTTTLGSKPATTQLATPTTQLAAVTPISQCDQCYTSIHSNNMDQATYCWTCHQILCQRCINQHLANRLVQHVPEGLVPYLQHQSDAYCSFHSLPTPALPTPINVGNSIIRIGVRSRALRYVGLYESFCESCSKLLCPTCKLDDGIHRPTSTHKIHPIRTIYETNSTALQHMIHTTIVPKRAALLETIATHTNTSATLKNDSNTIQSETLAAAQQSIQQAKKRQMSVLQQVESSKQLINAQLRTIEQIEHALTFLPSASSTPISASISPAIMSAFIHQAPTLIAQARQLASTSSGASNTNAILQLVQKEHEAILSERKERDDKIQALPALTHGISMKDRDLQSILSSRRGLLAESAHQAESLNQLYTSAHKEIQEWMSLTESMSREITSMKQSCQLCGLNLTIDTANRKCQANRSGLHAFAPTNYPQTFTVE